MNPTVARWLSIASLLLLLIGAIFVWRDARVYSLARNSLLLALATVLVAMPLGSLLAVWLVRTDVPGRRFLLASLMLQLFTPLYLQAAAWRSAIGKVEVLLGPFTNPLLPTLDGWAATVWIHSLAAIPWIVLIVGTGLRSVEAESEEAALLQASPGRTLVAVTCRRAAPFFVAAALWCALMVTSDMTVTDLFSVRTYAEQVYLLYQLGDDSYLAGLELAAGGSLVGILTVLALRSSLNLWTIANIGGWRRLRLFSLGTIRWLAAAYSSVVIAVSVGIPLASLLHEVGLEAVTLDGIKQRQWSLWHAAEIISAVWSESRLDLRTSCFISAITATLVIVVAIPLAWWGRKGDWQSIPSYFLAALGMAIPGPLVGSLLIYFVSQSNWSVLNEMYHRSFVAPCLALMVKSLSLPIILLLHTFRDIPEDQVDLARIDGASSFVLWYRIVAPQRWTAIAVAWWIAAVLAAGDIATSVLVMPPGTNTVALRVFGLLHSGVTDKVAALCLIVLAGCALTSLVIIAVQAKRKQ